MEKLFGLWYGFCRCMTKPRGFVVRTQDEDAGASTGYPDAFGEVANLRKAIEETKV
jgi:hypothetical protein